MSELVHGIAKTKAALEKVSLEIRAAAPASAKAGGEVLAHDMAARAPRRTGRLAASIVAESDGDTTHVGATVPYARFVEFGTVYMAAQSFETDAAEQPGSVAAAVAAILKAAIPG
jgi:HK97 gp10 family phage protein